MGWPSRQLGRWVYTRPWFARHLTKGDNSLFNLMTRQICLVMRSCPFPVLPCATGEVAELKFVCRMCPAILCIVKYGVPLITFNTLRSLSVKQLSGIIEPFTASLFRTLQPHKWWAASPAGYDERRTVSEASENELPVLSAAFQTDCPLPRRWYINTTLNKEQLVLKKQNKTWRLAQCKQQVMRQIPAYIGQLPQSDQTLPLLDGGNRMNGAKVISALCAHSLISLQNKLNLNEPVTLG